MSNPIASATFRDNVLFIQYSTSSSYLGNLFAINTAPSRKQPFMTALPQGSSNAPPTASSDPGSMYYSLQDIPYPPQDLSSSPVGVSMVSTATMTPGIGAVYELLIAFNLPPTSVPQPPLMLQLLPLNNNHGTGLEPSGRQWDLISRNSNPTLSVNGTNRVWLASGINSNSANPGPEGSAMYKMIQNPTSFTLQMVDVSQGDSSGNILIRPSWNVFITSLAASIDPRMIRLPDSGLYDVALVGKCANTPSTCLVFMSGKTQIPVTTSTPYDQMACFTAANGAIVMVTDSGTNTLGYINGTASEETWTPHMNPAQGSSPGQVLACAASGTTVYAVTTGSKLTPSLWSMDISSNSSWTWSPRSLRQSPLDNGSPGDGSGGPQQDPSPKHSSTALRVGIIVAVVVVVAVFVYLCYTRRSKNRAKDPFRGMTTADTLPRSGPASPSHSQGPGAIPMQPLAYQQNPYSSPPPQPQPVVVTPSRSGSWTAESAAAVASAAMAYNAQTSYNNMTPATSAPYSSAGPSYSGPAAYSAPTQMPIIASSLSIAPFRPFIVPLGSPVMSENGGFSSRDTPDHGAGSNQPERQTATSESGSKQEFGAADSMATNSHDSDDGTPLVRSRPIPVSTTASTTLASIPSATTSIQQPPLTRSVRPMQEMMSPAMVNAQLILQQSQNPPHRQ
ncbi:hypothetical protein EMPS_11108 [Entomortierella parvispora]|uniref:Transmembrane protein n=1 Tax=Entomortierella parvispora TaxID=205924 RepID=A0A9P3HL57_9FUNG|nr:hypothetical protein EMPS_11108 [Entomortierella parvispora]